MANPHARALRRASTDAERALWRLLRARRFHGHKFRRQHPIGPTIADFACVTHRLIIEADGGQHDARSEPDARRTAWLDSQGWRVLRFWNPEILHHPEAVAARILEALETAPPPHLSRSAGEVGRAQRAG